MKTSFFTTAAFAAVLTIGSLGLSAADAPDAAPGGPGGGRRGPGGPGGPGGGGMRGGGGFVNLDDKQRELLREAMQKDTDKIRDLDEQLRAAQKELVKATLAEKYDDKVVREKAEAMAKIQTDITVLRAKAFSSVAPTLKPEQRDQLENSPFGAAMITRGFGGGGMGGGAGFGGRGGGGPPDAAPGGPGGGGRRRGGGGGAGAGGQ